MDDGSEGRTLPETGEADGASARPVRPTLKTIAYMTGLGVTTVSRALSDAPDIGAETKERVRLVARQIGYRPNRAGVRLRTGRTNVIALILNTDEEVMGLTSQIVYGISEVLAPTQYHLVLTPYSHSSDALEPVRYVLETGSADGVILSRTEPDDPRVRLLAARNFPFATHGRTAMGIDHPFHDFDNRAFAAAAVRRLAARGRRKLALLPPPHNLTYYGHMQSGFSETVNELGLSEMTLQGVTIDDTLRTVQAATAEIMRRPNRPDGIVSGAGAAAIALTAGIEAAGLKLGTDVDLVSKQSTPILEWVRPEIIVTFEDFREAGRALARAVLARIAGQPATELQSISQPV